MLLADRTATIKLLELADRHEATLRDACAGSLDLEEHWVRRLRTLLDHAKASGVYADRAAAEWRSLAETLADARPREALASYSAHWPLLSKERVRATGLSALTRPLSEVVQYFESSGSTGDATPAPKAWDDYLRNTINIARGWERAFTDKSVALVLINAPFAPAPYQFQRVLEYLGIPFLRPWVDNVSGDYARVLRLAGELGVDTFVGPPSRLLQLIEAAQKLDLPPVELRALLLMAEQCGPAFQEHLRRLTRARPLVAAYGASETGTVAVGCEAGALHVQLQSFIVELRPPSGGTVVVTDDMAPATGELIVSTLDLPLRPLLRFCTGDYVTVKPSSCACGRRLPELVTHGRTADRLVFRDELQLVQEDIERALWQTAEDDVAAVNYMLVISERSVLCLVTSSRPQHAAVYADMEDRLQDLCKTHRCTVRHVESLPAVASLGQFLGWKMSRVLDAREVQALQRLPHFVRQLVEDALELARDGR